MASPALLSDSLASESPASDLSTLEKKLSVQVVGVPKELKQSLQESLELIDERVSGNTPNNINAYIETLETQATKKLQTLGYYHSSIDTKTASYKSSTAIQLDVSAGEPVIIRDIDVSLDDSAQNLDEFKQAIRELLVTKGSVLVHEEYEISKRSLLKAAQALGYFDAQFERAEVLLHKNTNVADIYLALDTGKRYEINQVVYIQNLYSDDFLKRWQTFEVTVPYNANYVRDLTVNLQSSGYFKSVRVTPDIQLATNNKIPLIVDLVPAKENTVSLGAGFATDSGPRVKANWFRPHTNSLGHSLESSFSFSKLRNEISGSYRIPHQRSPSTNNYSFEVGLLNQKTDDTYSQLRTIEIADHRIVKKNWAKDVFLRLENEKFDLGTSIDRSNLLLPGIGFSRIVSSGGINPDSGSYISAQVMGASEDLFSDINMLRLSANAKYLNSINRTHYFIARAQLGAINTNRFDRVPTTHRFFAGGDNSVRGYPYQAISPRNNDGDAIGGKYLTTSSAEYNYYFREKIALAAFIDSGKAFTESDDWKYGAGIGLRWRSPVGPLRVDIAHGFDNEDSPYRLHLAIGPEL